ncbi:hypothetical protein AYI69_g7508 [Smittium culicis]|uniref:Uncharacterized protein n=1 Tax=Smittium culicis TaxID=133412 RepID=A0A1R1XRC5_9FUNG|nr:hypothetical protein AYI69_g7508 [Smittium culicis]
MTKMQSHSKAIANPNLFYQAEQKLCRFMLENYALRSYRLRSFSSYEREIHLKSDFFELVASAIFKIDLAN